MQKRSAATQTRQAVRKRTVRGTGRKGAGRGLARAALTTTMRAVAVSVINGTARVSHAVDVAGDAAAAPSPQRGQGGVRQHALHR